MARPAQTDARATRDRILDHAITAFAEHGFSAVSTRTLAASASVNIGTLSYHFGSKQGVYEAAVALAYQRIESHAQALAPALLTNGDFRSQVAALVDFSRDHRQSARLLLREILDFGSLRPGTEAGHFLPNVESYAKLIGERFGLEARGARSLLVGCAFLLSRFVIQSDASLALALDVLETEVRDTIVDLVHRFAASQLSAPDRTEAVS